MPGVHRQGDSTSGHGCWPPTVPASYSPNVFVNGKAVVRSGDSIVEHCCTQDPYPCHTGVYTGSHTVKVNGRDKQVAGDPISCGDTASGCSSNVFVN